MKKASSGSTIFPNRQAFSVASVDSIFNPCPFSPRLNPPPCPQSQHSAAPALTAIFTCSFQIAPYLDTIDTLVGKSLLKIEIPVYVLRTLRLACDLEPCFRLPRIVSSDFHGCSPGSQ